MSAFLGTFSDPAAVARYVEGPPRFTPGFHDLHRMTSILLAERTPADARVLVLGAGGGLELRAFAEARPGWAFDGVDPAGEMLRLAKQTLGPLSSRVRLHQGIIDDAPAGPFDAATCLLTLHFLDPAERRRTLAELRRRLKPGAPFVAAHLSVPAGEQERDNWMARYAAFAVASGVDADRAAAARVAVSANLPILSPAEDEALLREAGFTQVEVFYTAFTWRGWVARA